MPFRETDYIDVYPMHLYVGSSFAGWQLVQGQEAARARHFLGPASEQLDSQLRALGIRWTTRRWRGSTRSAPDRARCSAGGVRLVTVLA